MRNNSTQRRFRIALFLLAGLSSLVDAKAKATSKADPKIRPPAPIVGQTTDSRNGKTYRTVVIGNQTWMAENLNFPLEQSACYENQRQNCDKFGRLYEWETAKKACPAGWHLPSDDEWTALETGLGGLDSASRKLKSATSWSNGGGGTDSKAFAALAAGSLDKRGVYVDQELSAAFWTSSSKFGGGAWCRRLSYETAGVERATTEKTNALSIRCLKD